jgi:hypothetical protein
MWYFLSMHKDPVKKTNKMCKNNNNNNNNNNNKRGTIDIRKENLRTPITHSIRTGKNLFQW